MCSLLVFASIALAVIIVILTRKIIILKQKLEVFQKTHKENLKQIDQKDTLLKNEFFFHRIVDELEIPIWLFNIEGKLLLANKATRKFNSSNIQYKHFDELCLLNQKWAELIPNISDKQPFLYELELPSKIEQNVTTQQNPQIQQLQFCILKDELRNVLGINVVAIDITNKKQLEDDLLDMKTRYLHIFDNVSDIVYTHDLMGRFTSINKTGTRILNFSKEEFEFLTLLQIVAPDFQSIARQSINKKVSKEVAITSYPIEVITRDNRQVSLEVTSQLITHKGKPVGVIGIAHDITERKNLEAQLYQSQKMEAIGQLAGGIAHDFNNLLTVISGYNELIIKKLEKESPLYDYTEEIKAAADRAAALTQQLLAFSRKQVLHPKVLDLNNVVEDISKMLKRLIGEQIEFIMELAPDLGQVKADPHQIEQVIINLAVNACDAMPAGGKLLIRTSNTRRQWKIETRERQYWESIDSGPPTEYVTLEISDTGIGMDLAIQERIFEPFFTTKEVGKGTGLGLSVVDGIVAQSKGHIEVFSQLGQGTIFKIYLPRLDSDKSNIEINNKQNVSPQQIPLIDDSLKGKSILLVEDETIVRKLLKKDLQLKGYKVIDTGNGKEAIALCKQGGQTVDILIADVVMPHIGGIELAEQITKLFPNAKVIFMSGYAKDVDIKIDEKSFKNNSAFLQKPFSSNALLRKIYQLFNS